MLSLNRNTVCQYLPRENEHKFVTGKLLFCDDLGLKNSNGIGGIHVERDVYP